MIATLARMRIAIWRRTPNELRPLGIAIGALLALATLALAGGAWSAREVTGPLLALAFAVWLAGWTVGPIQTGGRELLRAEWFASLPIPPRRLATGLLVAGCAGIGPAITALACAGLALYGASLGAAGLVAGILAAPLTVLLLITVSKVAAEAVGAAAASRIVLELTALQYGLFIAAMAVGWAVLPQIFGFTAPTGDPLPAGVRTAALALPTGWGVVAVDAADEGEWPLVAAALAGLAALIALGLTAWARLLERRAATPARSVSRPRARARRRLLPASPLGAVVGKDLRTWWRDPRRGVELRSSVWAGVFVVAALWLWVPEALAFAGAVIALLGAMACVNVYAMDGTALWCTLMSPGAERPDVRGRQLAWLAIFAPLAIVPSAVGLALAAAAWPVPWVLALVPALLGAGAGLIPLLSVVALVPETDAHKRGGNPAETGGDATGLYFATLFSLLALAAPAAGLLIAGAVREQPALTWAGAVVGAVIGAAYAWGLGELAMRRLAARGPELLLAMRAGPAPAREPAAGGPTRRQSWANGLLMTAAMICLFPQGLVPLVQVVFGVGEEARVWFASRYAPEALQVPAAVVFIALGLVAAWWALKLQRRYSNPS